MRGTASGPASFRITFPGDGRHRTEGDGSTCQLSYSALFVDGFQARLVLPAKCSTRRDTSSLLLSVSATCCFHLFYLIKWLAVGVAQVAPVFCTFSIDGASSSSPPVAVFSAEQVGRLVDSVEGGSRRNDFWDSAAGKLSIPVVLVLY